MKIRRQHYVWRKYLEPWCEEGKIWCHRRGVSPFHTNPINVAVEKDFYKLSKLTVNDALFIYKLAIKPIKNPALRRLNADWISIFEGIFNLAEGLRNSQVLSSELLLNLDEIMHNLDELHNTALENFAANYLDSLIQGDSSFYKDDDSATEFAYFMASQYFRTKNIRSSVFKNMGGIIPKNVSIDRTWPILRYIFSTCVGFSLYANRDRYILIVLNNAANNYFITCDQPVQNTHAAGRLGKEIVDEVELYYPVSPNRAVLISADRRYADKEANHLETSAVTHFNDIVKKGAFEQIFTKTSDCAIWK